MFRNKTANVLETFSLRFPRERLQPEIKSEVDFPRSEQNTKHAVEYLRYSPRFAVARIDVLLSGEDRK